MVVVAKRDTGLVRLARGEPHPGAVVLTTFFAGQFAVAAALALTHAWERRGVHEPFTFPVHLLAAPGVLLQRLNHEVAYAVARTPVSAGTVVPLDIGLGREVPARVTAAERGADEQIVRLALDGLAPTDRDALDRHLFQTALPRFLEGQIGRAHV